MMTILLIIAGFFVFTLIASVYAYWPEDPDQKVERAVTEELSRRQFKARVDAEVARRDEKGGQK